MSDEDLDKDAAKMDELLSLQEAAERSKKPQYGSIEQKYETQLVVQQAMKYIMNVGSQRSMDYFDDSIRDSR